MTILLPCLSVGPAGCGKDSRSTASPSPSPGASVVLISIDTLRADHLSAYGYPRPTSPNIDAFARRCLQFDHAYSHASSTGPSHMTMMTGVLPEVHMVWHTQHNQLASGVPYLAEILGGHGYDTAAFTDGGYLTPNFGFSRGFATFQFHLQEFQHKLDEVQQWLDETRDRTRPVFLFVHTYGVHAP